VVKLLVHGSYLFHRRDAECAEKYTKFTI
jgi:hypothetical protein